MPRGFFITFEGLDGAGKTTQLQRLHRRLEHDGYTVVALRQPGGTPLGTRIRSLLVDSRAEADHGPLAPRAELALMFADRAQSIAEVIQPALDAGSIVLCDRYTDSSEAYQGAGRGLGVQLVRDLHRSLCQGLDPDLTLLLLPPLAVSLERARRRNSRHLQQTGIDENRFEQESTAFFERTYEAFQQISRRDPERVVSITEAAPLDVIEQHIANVVLPRLPALADPPAP